MYNTPSKNCGCNLVSLKILVLLLLDAAVSHIHSYLYIHTYSVRTKQFIHQLFSRLQNSLWSSLVTWSLWTLWVDAIVDLPRHLLRMQWHCNVLFLHCRPLLWNWLLLLLSCWNTEIESALIFCHDFYFWCAFESTGLIFLILLLIKLMTLANRSVGSVRELTLEDATNGK